MLPRVQRGLGRTLALYIQDLSVQESAKRLNRKCFEGVFPLSLRIAYYGNAISSCEEGHTAVSPLTAWALYIQWDNL